MDRNANLVDSPTGRPLATRRKRTEGLQHAERFSGPSGRALFSDEGGFTFSEAPFEGTLHEGLKGLHLRKTSRGLHLRKRELEWRLEERFTFGRLQEGLKEASRGLEGGLSSEGEAGFEGT